MKKPKVYSIQWFINKFKGIPRASWTHGNVEEDTGGKCVLGHCGVKEDYEPTRASKELHKILFPETTYRNLDLYKVNDSVLDPRAAFLRRLERKKKAS